MPILKINNMNEIIEIWKDIPGYEGIYQIGSLGNVKSLGNNARRKEKILTSFSGEDRNYVMLSKKRKVKSYRIKELVAQAFLGYVKSIGSIKLLRHKNGIKTDNRVENLEILDRSERITSNYKYICYSNVAKVWKIFLRINGKQRHIGNFKTEKDAYKRLKEVKKMMKNNDFSFLDSKKTSKYKGVNWYKPYKKWRASLYSNRKIIHLGYFTDELEAYDAYLKGLEQYRKS
jgi:hypothetical protein